MAERPVEASPQDRFIAGVDLGSTGLKVLVINGLGAEVGTAQVPTPWRVEADGEAELDAASLEASIRQLLASVSTLLETRPGARIEAIGIAGMGETGMLIGPEGSPIWPAYAWFDPRGAEQIAAFPQIIQAQFAGRTGLPLSTQATMAKLAYLHSTGFSFRGLRWLNLPEYVAYLLGGDFALEYSLASRTGLLDQGTGAPWPAMHEALQLDPDFLPPLRDAGVSWGHVSDDFGPILAGAELTVCGHDHLVAATCSGTVDADGYLVSMGTAEVLLRTIDGGLGFGARKRLTDLLINEVRHVIPGKHVLVAGLKTGLLLRRALTASGISDRKGRDELDAAVMAAPYEGNLPVGSIEVRGARNDDGVLRLTLRGDGATPAEVFSAILRHSNDEIQILVDAIEREVPPATHTTLTGGWSSMASVQRARAAVLPAVEVDPREQAVALGAAFMAARLVGLPLPH